MYPRGDQKSFRLDLDSWINGNPSHRLIEAYRWCSFEIIDYRVHCQSVRIVLPFYSTFFKRNFREENDFWPFFGTRKFNVLMKTTRFESLTKEAESFTRHKDVSSVASSYDLGSMNSEILTHRGSLGTFLGTRNTSSICFLWYFSKICI